jgi:hypothetical protein
VEESDFHSVLVERPEVSQAVIHVLTGYIRRLLAGDQSARMKGTEAFEP